MLDTKFYGNRPASSGDFRWVFTIYGHGGHLGHLTSIISTKYNFHVPKNLYKIWFLRKTCFNFHTYMAFGQKMTLTINTHIPS